MERLAPKRKLNGGGSYFTSASPDLRFIRSGCTLLDCVLGGGYPLGRMVNVIGDKSTGKCVKNAYILDPNQGMILLDNTDAPSGASKIAGGQTLALRKNVTVVASHFYRERVAETIKVTTRHGYEIEGTNDHSILTWTKDSKYKMKPLSELREGDVAIIERGLFVFPDEAPSLEDAILAARADKNIHSQNEHSVRFPKRLTEWLATLFGLFVADGNIVEGANAVFLSNSQPWFRRITNEIKRELGLPHNVSNCISSVQLVKFVRHILGHPERFTARFKYVPDVILRAPREMQAAFLRALIDCDSWLDKSGTCIGYSTASATLAEQVKLMLLNFGILCTHEKKDGVKVGDKYYDHVYHSLTMYGPDVTLFRDLIGSVKYAGKLNGARSRKSEYDSIPYLLDHFRAARQQVRQDLKVSKNGLSLVTGKRFPRLSLTASKTMTFDCLEKIIEAYSSVLGFDCTFYKAVLQRRYHYDPIASVEKVKGPTDVYDVHVPETHRFWANGFINHNTLLAIEAAANLAKDYPKGLIWYREAEAAFDKGYAGALGMPLNRVDFGKKRFETIEDIFEDLSLQLKHAANKGAPGLYIIDSLDALSDRDELGRDMGEGSYNLGKQKKLGELFRRKIGEIESTSVCVMIISQIRDKIGVTFGDKTTRSGGKAMDFYASQALKLAHLKTLTATIKGVKRAVGIRIKGKCVKNKIGLPLRECEFVIRFGYGIENYEAGMQWLIETGHTDALGVTKAEAAKLISDSLGWDEDDYLMHNNALNFAVQRTWRDVETDFLPSRRKY